MPVNRKNLGTDSLPAADASRKNPGYRQPFQKARKGVSPRFFPPAVPVFSKLFLAVALLAAAFAALRPAAAAPVRLWWDSDWGARKEIQVAKKQKYLDSTAAAITFSTHGRVAADGRDIRIIDSRGKEVPSKVVSIGPDDTATVIFHAKSDSKTFYAYFDNGEATAPEYGWEPRFGVILETRKFPGGQPNSWKAMQDILSRATEVYGRGIVGKIWHGVNIFGPDDYYISIYRGWLRVPADGTYSFVTASDDASFMLLDGELVVQWPGWHGAWGGRYGEHAGKKTLTRGVYLLEYYHVEGTSGQCALAAWKKPGAKYPTLMQDTDFSGFLDADVVGFKERGKAGAADFDWRLAADAFDFATAREFVIAYRFSDNTGRATRGYVVSRWDFGDGQTASRVADSGNIEHVYLEEGFFNVTLTVEINGKAAETLTQRVWVHPTFDLSSTQPWYKVEGLDERLKKYDYAKLPPRSCVTLAHVMKVFAEWEDAVKAYRALFASAGNIHERYRFDSYLDCAAILREELKRPADAIEILQEGVDKTKNRQYRLVCMLAMGEAYMDDIGDLDKALFTFTGALKMFSGLTTNEYRLAQIRVGDVHKKAGNVYSARVAYEKAAEMPFKRASKLEPDESIKPSDYELKANQYVARGDVEEAFRILKEWEDELPMEKLLGRTDLVRVKGLFKLRRFKEAITTVDTFRKIDPQSPYLPLMFLVKADSLYVLGNEHEDDGLLRESLELYTELAEKYTEHPDVERMKRMIKRISMQLGVEVENGANGE